MNFKNLWNQPFNEVAKKEDVFNCYRLILGRNPDSDGWANHLSKLGGIKVNQMAEFFLDSPEFRGRAIFRRMMAKSPNETPVLVDLDDYKLYISPNDAAVGLSIMKNKVYESHVTKALKSVLEPDMVFLDVGANIGYFTLLAARSVGPKGKVICFEPNQYNCNLLYLSAKINQFENIQIYPLAAAEKPSSFIYEPADGSNGTITEELPHQIDDEYLETLAIKTLVSSIRLDDLLRNLERLDVVKVDIEGAEYRAFKGAMNLIHEHHPIIFSEFSPVLLKFISQASGEDYLQMLIREDYNITILNWNGRMIECGQDVNRVMRYYRKEAEKGLPHIDIVAHTEGKAPVSKTRKPGFLPRWPIAGSEPKKGIEIKDSIRTC